MKMLKKSISVILIVILSVCCMPINAVVNAENNLTWFDFSSIEKEVNNYNNAADDVDVGVYLGDHYTSFPTNEFINYGLNKEQFAIDFIERMEKNTLFKTAYSAWETASFVSDPVSGVIKALSKETFYKTALFKILNSTFTSDNFIDWVNRGAIKNTTKFCKILSKAAALDYKYDIANRISITELSEESKKHIIETVDGIIENDPNQYIAKCVGSVSSILEASKSVEEFAERVGTYYRLTQVADETISFLAMLKERTDDQLLIKAIDTVLAVTDESYNSFFDVIAKDAVISIGKAAIKSALGGKWKDVLFKVLSAGKLTSGAVLIDGALLGVTIGQTVSNISFNTNKKLEHYELLKAFVATEKAIKSVVGEQMSSYSGNSEEGFLLAAGIDLLYQTYDLDSELCLDLVNIMDKDWIQLSSQEERNYIKDVINSEKTYFSEQYKRVSLEQGSCGKNLYWIFNPQSKELLVYGYGEMYDYEKGQTPWHDLRESVSNLYISSYCWKIGKNAFSDFTGVGPVILTNEISESITYGSGCFDNINAKSHIIFPEMATAMDINVQCPVYSLSDLNIKGNQSSISELYVAKKLYSSGTLTVNESGKLYAGEFDSSYVFLNAKENSTISFYGNAYVGGRTYYDWSAKKSVYLDSMKLFNGTTLTVFGNIYFREGRFYAYSGSDIYVSGNFEVGNGGENSFFYLYGSLEAGENIYSACGYMSSAVFYIYGTAKAKDIRQKYHNSYSNISVGVIGIFGKAYITDGNMNHTFMNVFTCSENAYVAVHGDVSNINQSERIVYEGINSKPCVGTIELFGNAHFYTSNNEKLTLIFSGDKKQRAYLDHNGWQFNENISAGKIIINNSNGVNFETPVTSFILFDHRQNPFTLTGDTNVFQDYDGDGLKDNIDPFPTDPLNGNNTTDFSVALDNGSLMITGYTGKSENIIIPSKIADYNVNSIGKCAIPNTIRSLSINAGIKNIDKQAFDSATALTTINVDSENTTYSSRDGILCSFDGAKIIKCPIAYEEKVLTLSDSISEIDEYAFANVGLTSMVLPESLTCIRRNAFTGNALTTVTIPESILKIEQGAFSQCSNLTTVNYNAVCAETGISPNIFVSFYSVFGSDSAVNTINIGSRVQSLPTGLFVKMSGLKTVNIANNSDLTNIEKFVFYGDTALSDVYYGRYYKDWKQIKIGSSNSPLTNATLHCIECDECSWDEGAVTKEATCVNTGIRLFTCKVCGKERTEVIAVNHDNHVGETSVINQKKATCVEDGYSGDTICADCNSIIKHGESIAKAGHKPSKAVVENEISATCTDTGSYDSVVYCSVCNYEISRTTVTTDALGHISSDWIVVDNASCETVGKKQKVCTRCNTVLESTDIPVTDNHEYKDIITHPTCITQGYTTHTCTVCGSGYIDNYVEKLGHSFSNYLSNGDATCTKDGTMTAKCDRCNETDTISDINSAKGHSKFVIPSVAATCTDKGKTEGMKCSVCGEVLVDQKVLPALGHNFVVDTEAKDPTCTENGTTEGKHCTRCDYSVEAEVIEPLGHTDSNNDGKCDRCGEETHKPVNPPKPDPSANCTCACHKKGIAKFFFKIGLFFQKIFKKNKICKCGVWHY